MLFARKVIAPAPEARPRFALVPDTVSDWKAMRRPVDPSDNVLHHRTIKWLATLPADLRPIATGRLHPRIVNRIGDLWSQCEYTRLHFQSLLIDRRKGRRGFPSEVKAELEALQRRPHGDAGWRDGRRQGGPPGGRWRGACGLG